MGVHWALNAAQEYPGRVEVLDLRTLYPLDEVAIFEVAKRHGRVLVITEEPVNNTFAQSIAARVGEHCFQWLDAPVRTIGAVNMPAVPLNEVAGKGHDSFSGAGGGGDGRFAGVVEENRHFAKTC